MIDPNTIDAMRSMLRSCAASSVGDPCITTLRLTCVKLLSDMPRIGIGGRG